MKDTIRLIIQDKPVLSLSIAILALAIAYMVAAVVMIHASDLQVVVHYSAFGETNFYRGRWYYLIGFVVMAGVVAFSHVGLMGKLLGLDKRQIAITIGWLTIALLVTAFLLTRAVLQVASLV